MGSRAALPVRRLARIPTVSEADRERVELLRKIFDPGTPDGTVRKALAQVPSLELPPPLGYPVLLGTTQGLAGFAVGQESAVTEMRDVVGRVLLGWSQPCGRSHHPEGRQSE